MNREWIKLNNKTDPHDCGSTDRVTITYVLITETLLKNMNFEAVHVCGLEEANTIGGACIKIFRLQSGLMSRDLEINLSYLLSYYHCSGWLVTIDKRSSNDKKCFDLQKMLDFSAFQNEAHFYSNCQLNSLRLWLNSKSSSSSSENK